MNWPLIIILGIVIIAFILFIVIRNLKDESDFENVIKNDYHKAKNEEGDIEIDEKMK
jgi:large-conductance mechanosensitive channel